LAPNLQKRQIYFGAKFTKKANIFWRQIKKMAHIFWRRSSETSAIMSLLCITSSFRAVKLEILKDSSQITHEEQGCQMVCLQTKNPHLGQFWRVLQWKVLVYFMVTWFILRPFVIFYVHLV
jgi:hypothetical protein